MVWLFLLPFPSATAMPLAAENEKADAGLTVSLLM